MSKQDFQLQKVSTFLKQVTSETDIRFIITISLQKCQYEINKFSYVIQMNVNGKQKKTPKICNSASHNTVLPCSRSLNSNKKISVLVCEFTQAEGV